jgi:spore coat protein U-like protein
MRGWITGAIAAMVAMMGASALAQTKTAQFAVRASVVADCQVTANDLDFGTYNSATAASGSNQINLKCTPGSAATVSLDGGQSGNPQARHMTGQNTNLNYQLYRDAGHTDAINTAGMAFQLKGSDNTGQNVIYNVYGQVPANQAVPAGNYTDTVRVTVTY